MFVFARVGHVIAKYQCEELVDTGENQTKSHPKARRQQTWV